MEKKPSWSTEEFQGLEPAAIACVDEGFSKESVKGALLKKTTGFLGQVVTDPLSFAAQIAGVDPGIREAERIEILKSILTEPRLSKLFPSLVKKRRSQSSLRKLDQAIAAGRLCYFSEMEYRAMSAVLDSKAEEKERNRREEFFILAQSYEAWLENLEAWDYPRILKKAIEALNENQALPKRFSCLRKIILFRNTPLELLETEFWQAIGKHVEIIHYPNEGSPNPELPNLFRSHTWDDAAEGIARSLASGDLAFSRCGFVIPDHPGIRRTLTRALARHGVPLREDRDPTEYRRDEALKKAILPIKLKANQFTSKDATEWIFAFHASNSRSRVWTQSIEDLGIDFGIESYAQGELVDLGKEFQELENHFGEKPTVGEAKERHLKWLESKAATLVTCQRIQEAWEEIEKSLSILGKESRKVKWVYWLSKLTEAVSRGRVFSSGVVPTNGVSLHRITESPPLEQEMQRIWFFGISPDRVFESRFSGEWFSEFDRERLSLEFGVRSAKSLTLAKQETLRRWLSSCEEACWVHPEYDSSDREMGSLALLWRVIGRDPPSEEEFKTLPWLEVPEWVPSSLPRFSIQNQNVILRDVPTTLKTVQGKLSLSATDLDAYSRCAFLSLAQNLWKLSDPKLPGDELSFLSKGNILHKAVELLARGEFDPESALEQAWKISRPKGLLRSSRTRRNETRVKRSLLGIVHAYWAQEQEYIKRSGVSVYKLEDREPLKLDFGWAEAHGRPDRIDRHEDGLFVLDFKTSSVSVSGEAMVQDGYRLQLPFYGAAAAKTYGLPVIGVQRVQLLRKPKRSQGIHFKKWNGASHPNPLTQLKGRSFLFNEDPESIWEKCEGNVEEVLRAFATGNFSPVPKEPSKDCMSCRYHDLCGRNRIS